MGTGYDPYTNIFTPAPWTPIFGPPGVNTGSQAPPTTPNSASYGTNPTSTPPATGGSQNPTNLGSDPLQGWGDLSNVMGAASSGAKADRALKGQFTQNYDRLMLEAQQENRAQQAAGLSDLAKTKYILGGGNQYKPTTIQLNGKQVTLPDYGFGPTASSDAQKQGAQTLQDQALKMLSPGGNYTPQPLSGYANPGTMENVGNYGSILAGFLGGVNQLSGNTITNYIKKLFGGGTPAAAPAGAGGAWNFSNALSDAEQASSAASGLGSAFDAMPNAATQAANESMPWTLGGMVGDVADTAGGFTLANAPAYANLGFGQVGTDAAGNSIMGGSSMPGTVMSNVMGKVLPGIGAAYSAYQLAKNKSKSSDLMSGMGTGAGIGTMVLPGIGTAVGAGIGALGGLARHAFGGPDQVEKAGRSTAADTFGQIGSSATDAQKQQAASAGWKNPNEALAYIVMSDQLRAEGKDPSLADKYMKTIQDAEKHGSQAVGSAIQQMMAGQHG